MKKVLSILAVLLTVASVPHVSVARHYCHGVPVATRVTLTGEHATCGMEESENTCPMPGAMVDTHCCDDIVSLYGIDNTCVSNNYSAPVPPNTIKLANGIVTSVVTNALILNPSGYADTGPPVFISHPAVDLPVICQFRL